MLRRSVLAAGVATAFAGARPAPAAAGAPARPDQLRDALDRIVATGASAALAEVRGPAGTWRAASGTAALGGGRPAAAHGRFRIASITKTFVATVVLQLAAEERLRLDEPIGRWLPGGGSITARHLLRHTSGVYDVAEKLRQLFPTNEDLIRERLRAFTARELVAMAAAEPPLFAPGTGWSYSNTNYLLLGLVIERVTGRPYAAEVSRRVLRPLRLAQTELPGTDPRLRGPHAHGYLPVLRDGAVAQVDVTEWNPSWAGASGEIISTTEEVNRFYRALLGGRLLPPAQLEQMLAHPAGPDEYGLGIRRVTLPSGTTLWGHTGGFPGYETWAYSTEDGGRQLTLSVNPLRTPDRGNPFDAMVAFVQTAFQ